MWTWSGSSKITRIAGFTAPSDRLSLPNFVTSLDQKRTVLEVQVERRELLIVPDYDVVSLGPTYRITVASFRVAESEGNFAVCSGDNHLAFRHAEIVGVSAATPVTRLTRDIRD